MIRREKSLSIRGLSGKKRSSKFVRPNSAVANKKFQTIKINNGPYNQTPPPIIFTMPNNKKMTSGMGNNIEREQLYENNMQLKESLNKLKRELAETKYYVVKKDIELRTKEKIIRDCIKENDIESNHEGKIEKAKESALLTLFKEKYDSLKNSYQKEIQENKILKANIKITKIKEFQIENDILHRELLKIKSLYGNSKKNLKKCRGIINDLNHFKAKFMQQHSIISSYIQKCELLNAEIRNLKEERDNLIRDLEINIKKQDILKKMNNKLKLKNLKFLNQKKLKEEFDFKCTDNEKNILKLKKDASEFKRAFFQKNTDYENLKKLYENSQIKLNNAADNTLLKPFQYKNIKHIEQENNPKNIDKIELYKSLYEESQMKNAIYEKYLKDKNINPKDIIREYGYSGVLNTENKLLLINHKDNDKEKDKDKDKNNIKSDSQINEKEENKEKNNIINNKKEEIIPIINNNERKVVISNSDNNNNIINNNIIKEEEDEKDKKDNNNQIEIANSDEIKTKISDDNFSNINTNTYTKANTISNNNNIIRNINEDDKIKEKENDENENQFLALIHLFLKNFEANNVTTEMLDNKLKDIFQSFDGKVEVTKEEFILPFYNLFIESMKVTQETDKEIIQTFFNDYIDNLKGNINEFYNELITIFENVIDYSSLDINDQLLDALAISLQKYKNDLEKRLKEDDKEGTNIITYDIFRNIINDLNIPLNDDLLEYLIYKMKSMVPEGRSIFDLNYKIILELLSRDIHESIEEEKNNEEEDEKESDDLSKQISNKLSDFKNNMIKENTDLEKVFKDKVQTFKDEQNDYEVIEKNVFFEMMEKYDVTVNEEIKETIYKLFINESPICTNNGSVMMMDFKKLKQLFLNDYYSEEN